MSMIEVPLHAVAHGRAGDKGNRSNISVVPYKIEAFAHLKSQLTEKVVMAVFRHKGATKVTRHVLPNLPALNFVIDDVLEGGVNRSLSVDLHGKTLSYLLLAEISVKLPINCLPDGSPYLQGKQVNS